MNKNMIGLKWIIGVELNRMIIVHNLVVVPWALSTVSRLLNMYNLDILGHRDLDAVELVGFDL